MSKQKRKKTYHILSTSLLSYWPVSMILLMVVSIIIVTMLRESIIDNFQTNIPLNSLIFCVIIGACIIAFLNNYKLLHLAKFIKRIDAVEDQPEVSAEDIESLQEGLKSQASMMDMHNMYVAIEKMGTYGHFTINDKDAMLIKSKLGGRVRNERNVIAYMAGTLVMLGLIGTFWGLLITIAAVGEAMGEVSESMTAGVGADSGSKTAGMVDFIAGISKPLQGMGIAFSSSLFGLTGSLFLGVLNFFAGDVQNKFMEDAARWIDLHIPSLNSKLAKKTGEMKVPGSDDLKSWLAAFVYLSNKTNRRMAMSYSAMTQLIGGLSKTASGQSELLGYQKQMDHNISEMHGAMQNMEGIMQRTSQAANPLFEFHKDINQSLQTLSAQFQNNQNHISLLTSGQSQLTEQLNNALDQIHHATRNLGAMQTQIQEKFDMTDEQKNHFEAKYNELSQFSVQMSKILEEIDQNNADMHSSIFSGNDEAFKSSDDNSEG